MNAPGICKLCDCDTEDIVYNLKMLDKQIKQWLDASLKIPKTNTDMQQESKNTNHIYYCENITYINVMLYLYMYVYITL